MEKLVKIFVIAGLSMAFAYAQGTVDTTVKKDSSLQVAKTASSTASSSSTATTVKKSVTGNQGKAKTNWSKVKDLFL